MNQKQQTRNLYSQIKAAEAQLKYWSTESAKVDDIILEHAHQQAFNLLQKLHQKLTILKFPIVNKSLDGEL